MRDASPISDTRLTPAPTPVARASAATAAITTVTVLLSVVVEGILSLVPLVPLIDLAEFVKLIGHQVMGVGTALERRHPELTAVRQPSRQAVPCRRVSWRWTRDMLGQSAFDGR